MTHATEQQPLDPIPDRVLRRELACNVVMMLRSVLPLPPIDTPEAWASRDRLAVARVTGLAPATIEETDIASMYVAALAHAVECLRLTVQRGADPAFVARQRAQYASMGREARGYRTLLTRLQAARRKDAADRMRATSAGPADRTASIGRGATRHGMIAPGLAVPDVAAPKTLASDMPAPDMPAPDVAAPGVPAPEMTVPGMIVPELTAPEIAGLMTQALATLPPPPPALDAAAPAEPERTRPLAWSDLTEQEQQASLLQQEADRYALYNTVRVQRIRTLGGLPPDCDYEPPRPEILDLIINGDTSTLRWADTYVAWVPPSPMPAF
jgi:hypothetical protein